MNFITKEEFESNNVDAINEGLTRAYNKAMEDVIRHIPSIVLEYTKKQSQLRELIGNFYNENPTFLPHKELVAFIVHKLEKESPDMLYGEILKKSIPIIQKKIEDLNKVVEEKI